MVETLVRLNTNNKHQFLTYKLTRVSTFTTYLLYNLIHLITVSTLFTSSLLCILFLYFISKKIKENNFVYAQNLLNFVTFKGTAIQIEIAPINDLLRESKVF